MQNVSRATAAGLIVVMAAGCDESFAQTPFDYFFGAPRRVRRPYRPPGHSDRPLSQGYLLEDHLPDVPLPVPRPHFAGDAAPPAAAVTSPVPAATVVPMAPAAPERQADAEPPRPPPRPADLAQTPVAPTTSISPAPLQPTAPPEKPAPPGHGTRDGDAVGPPHQAAPATPLSAAVGPSPVAPSGAAAGPPPRQPEDDASCPGRLKARNVSAEPVTLGPQPDDRCTIVQAVRLTAMTGADRQTIEFPDKPTIACVTADTFTHYVGEMLSPLAKGTYSAPVAAVWTGPGFECRSRDHIFGAKLSAHGQGLAVDIAQLKLTDGHIIAVGEPKTPLDDAFETAARAAGCGYFHTVLGPGSDSYHRTHWHFDLELRGAKGDSKYCR